MISDLSMQLAPRGSDLSGGMLLDLSGYTEPMKTTTKFHLEIQSLPPLSTTNAIKLWNPL